MIDWNVDNLHKIANETHHQETDPCCFGDADEFISVWFCALLNQVGRILGKLLQRFNQRLTESFLYHVSQISLKIKAKKCETVWYLGYSDDH